MGVTNFLNDSLGLLFSRDLLSECTICDKMGKEYRSKHLRMEKMKNEEL